MRFVVLAIVAAGLLACGREDKGAAGGAGTPPPGPTPQTAPAAPAAAAAPAAPESGTAGAGSGPQAAPAGASPAAGSPPRGAASGNGAIQTHTVVSGDTLGRLAKVYGVSVQDLMRWNDIQDPRRLRIGQELRLTGPGG